MKLTSFQRGIFNLISDTAKLYKKKSSDKIISKQIQRGTKSPISDFFEEEFTKLLSDVLVDKYEFIIDFHLSMYDLNGKYTHKHIKPDILVLESINPTESLVKAIFELKLDVSYTSDNWIEDIDKKINNFTNYKIKFRKYKTQLENGISILDYNQKGEPKRTEHIKLRVSNNLKAVGLVLCKDNDHNRWHNVTDSSKFNNIETFYLSKEHLNNPKIDLQSVLKQNNNQWLNLENYIRKSMNLEFK